MAETPSVKVIGGTTIKSCCKSSGGGGVFTNYALLGAGMTVGGEASRESVKLGSKYLYDSSLVGKGLGAINSWASGLGDGVFNPSFSYYGFSFQFSFANGFQMVSFDPYSFALQIAVMLINEWLSCKPPEQAMSLKRGQNLCVHYDTYCSKKFPLLAPVLKKQSAIAALTQN
jgi:conjugal transfer mating pair stabilization protein TraN